MTIKKILSLPLALILAATLMLCAGCSEDSGSGTNTFTLQGADS